MRKLLCLSAMLMLIGLQSWAQRTVTGTVTDDKGAPLANVSVQVKNSNIGTVTKENGAYSLSVPANAKTLVFSYVDMAPMEVNIGNQSVVNARLTNNDKSMEGVVVVGYGTQRRRNVTSSISKINGDEIANLPLPSVDKQIAGKAAGINVTLGSGLANSEPRIRIRGVNSISLTRDPLIVVDGVPTFSAREGGLSGVANTNALSEINPSDIESIEVLKDGAATAIYGSRAANGVILITTKKGRSGQSRVSYDMYMGMSKVFRKPDLLNAQEFVAIANEKLINAGLPIGAKMNNENTNTDWLDVVFRDAATAQSHTLSFSGGTDKTNFYVSMGYLRQDGIIITNKAERYAVRANLEHRPNQYIRFGNNINLGRTTDNDQNNGGNALSGAMGAALRALPDVRVYNPNHPTGYNIQPPPANDALGNDSNSRKIENNYVNIKYVLDHNKFNSEKYRITDNAFFDIIPIPQLVIHTQGSIDYETGTDFQFLDPIHGDGRSAGGTIFEQSLQRTRLDWQTYANYNQTFAHAHTVGITVGVEAQRDINRFFNAQASGLSDVFFASDNLITNTYANQFSGGSFNKFGFQSYFGRLTYDYKSKYFAQFSIRRDGLSSLAPENRFGVFPGGSLGWRLSEEDFWKKGNIAKIMNDVKLRGSYAQVGNTFTDFRYLSTYGPAPYGAVAGNAINRVGNRNLKWETNKKIDIGADFSFLNSRLNLTVDYFNNKNNGLIFDDPTPVSLGIPGNVITRNIADMQNTGWEFSVNGDAIRKHDFSWNINFNISFQDNKVLALRDTTKEQIVGGPNNGIFNILRVGEAINAMYGYEFAGVNSANGNPMWVKANGTLVQYNVVQGSAAGYYLVVKPGDPTLGAASTLSSADRKIIGSPVPKWYGGFTNTFNYKSFSAEVFFRFQGGNKVYNLTRQEVFLSQGFVNNGREILNRWTTPGQVTDVPKLYYGRDNQINVQGQADSRFVEDGDFLRLQNVTLSYTFGRGLLQRATNNYIKNVRIYFQGQNLAIWTKYSGIDPENTSELGIDNSSVPQLRTFTVGLNLGF